MKEWINKRLQRTKHTTIFWEWSPYKNKVAHFEIFSNIQSTYRIRGSGLQGTRPPKRSIKLSSFEFKRPCLVSAYTEAWRTTMLSLSLSLSLAHIHTKKPTFCFTGWPCSKESNRENIASVMHEIRKGHGNCVMTNYKGKKMWVKQVTQKGWFNKDWHLKYVPENKEFPSPRPHPNCYVKTVVYKVQALWWKNNFVQSEQAS